ncbi:hypothetical protein [Sphingomonas aerophila]|jgi:hypothetical protein|uniref:Uncharacterized protein n=1 Tax=Sphingomonas aerophila TaxID=1344948 RepID=A0A7W9BD85_9SPHN|nr:hypothetical protein [Sphingomonas aerophila]MBB5715105.1 hypothetical protein [Sphingomonas aerophila]
MFMTPVTQDKRRASPALSALGLAVPVLVMAPWLAVNGPMSALIVGALALVAGRETLVRVARDALPKR